MESKSSLRFSVIMCAYNLEKIVDTAIESILNQTFDNYELIIVNDGSKDDTIGTLRRFEKRSKGKIRIIDNPKNIGLSASRNIAISQAKGEYIVHLDGDDMFLDEDSFYTITNIAEKGNFDIVSFRAVFAHYSQNLFYLLL